jgi:hypothetical protein
MSEDGILHSQRRENLKSYEEKGRLRLVNGSISRSHIFLKHYVTWIFLFLLTYLLLKLRAHFGRLYCCLPYPV